MIYSFCDKRVTIHTATQAFFQSQELLTFPSNLPCLDHIVEVHEMVINQKAPITALASSSQMYLYPLLGALADCEQQIQA